jgi:hypothetical protein
VIRRKTMEEMANAEGVDRILPRERGEGRDEIYYLKREWPLGEVCRAELAPFSLGNLGEGVVSRSV